MFSRLAVTIAGAVIMLTFAGAARAVVLVTTDRMAFTDAIAGLAVRTQDFESTPAGTAVPDGTEIDGAGFTFERGPLSGGLDMIVSDQVDPGGNRYLGVGDPFSDLFLYLDGVSFGFSQPVVAIGLDLITPVDANLDDTGVVQQFYTLAAGAHSVSNGDPELGLFDDVYFLGIVDTGVPFSAASLASIDQPAFGFVSYSLDNLITARDLAPPVLAPSPAVLHLLVLALAVAAASPGARRRTPVPPATA